MITLTFVTPDAARHQVKALPGSNLMEIAVANGIAGILGDCGGNLVCGTCHVYVADRFHSLLPDQSQMELDILECVPEPRPGCRLTCQIQLENSHDGLELHVPSMQR